MFNFFKSVKYSVHPARIEGRAGHLVNFGNAKAFQLFKEEDVRAWLDFDKQDQVEQDRFFNEMVVTNIVMLMLILDDKIAVLDPGLKRDHFKDLRKEVPKTYAKTLRRHGVAEEHCSIWNKLIEMRYDEYSNAKLEWRSIIAEHNQQLGYDNRVALFQALAFGLYEHLKRGKVKKDDPLYKRLQNFLVLVYREFGKRIN